MVTYDHILVKQGDIQYKILMAEIAKANEIHERNRLKRIELAMKVISLPTSDVAQIEGQIGEDLNLEDGETE